MEHFVSRKAMDIDGLGAETIELLYNRGLAKGIADLYLLKKDQLAALERLGEKSAQRILNGLEGSKKVPFERVLFALGIRYVGETVAKKLVREVHSIDQLAAKTKEELTAIDEVGERIAESIIEFFTNPAHHEMIAALKKEGLQLQLSEEHLENRTDKLKGMSIVISGTFEKHSRDELKQLIEQHGGKNVGSVSKKTSYLLAGEKMGPGKREKAEKLGIPVISEEDFSAMIS